MNREKEVKAYLEGKLSQAEKLKYEIADEMGVLDKVIKDDPELQRFQRVRSIFD